ncbi:hypothetical protein ACYOEI_13780 [Singulisphaera rosea]
MTLTLFISHLEPPLAVLLSELGTPIEVPVDLLPKSSTVGDTLSVIFDRGEGGIWHATTATKAFLGNRADTSFREGLRP